MGLPRAYVSPIPSPIPGPDRVGLPWEAAGGGALRDACVGETLVADLDIASPTTETRECGVIVPDGLRIQCADGATLSISKVR